jgi:putative thiamine transport system permease protein
MTAAPLLLLVIAWLPVLAGLIGSLGPAGSADAWQQLWSTPGLWPAISLSLRTGVIASLLSLLLAHALLAAVQGTRGVGRLRAMALPLLATPHLALAIGVTLVIAPSGLLVRLVSPWLTGFQQPPDWNTTQDPWGIALIIGLVLKETPFLLIALTTALGQVPAERLMLQARTLGYGPIKGWLVAVAPLLQRQILLPFAAVVVFGIGNVDVAIALGPTTPPPFAMLLWQWFVDPDLNLRPMAAAGSLLLAALCSATLVALTIGARASSPLLRRWRESGQRRVDDAIVGRLVQGTGAAFALLGLLAVAMLLLRSTTGAWRFPAVLPTTLDFAGGSPLGAIASDAGLTTLALALASTSIAIVLCLAAAESLRDRPAQRALLGTLLFLPLLLPQFSFLFGLQVLLAALHLDGSWTAVIWSHLLYVLPYAYGVIAAARISLDPRLLDVARTLGAGPWRAFWTVTLPLLGRAVLWAAALGFSVSVAVYLPTLFAGAGRFTTLATDAAATISAGSLRSAALAAAAMAMLPLIALTVALLAAKLLHRGRRGVPA